MASEFGATQQGDWSLPTFPGYPGAAGGRPTHWGLYGNLVRALMPPKAAGRVDRPLGGAGIRGLPPIEAHLCRRSPSHSTRSALMPTPVAEPQGTVSRFTRRVRHGRPARRRVSGSIL